MAPNCWGDFCLTLRISRSAHVLDQRLSSLLLRRLLAFTVCHGRLPLLAMVSYDPPYGFPLRRNGSCLESETSCGRTWENFHACCPGNSVCPGATQSIPNNVCCPSEADCTDPLDKSPHCAVANATMFDHTGYFCCLDDQTGFWTDSPKDAVGCSNGVPDNRGYSILNPISFSE